MTMKPTDRILRLLTECAPKALRGFLIGEICGLGSYRLYLALAKLERAGKIVSEWESEFKLGPRPRIYKIKEGD